MNKSQLAKKLATQTDLTARDAFNIVCIFFDQIQNALADGRRVEIRGLGSFVMREHPAYKGRNPQTGETVIVGPKRCPYFRPGKDLYELLNPPAGTK